MRGPLGDLPAPVLAELLRLGRRREYAAGETLLGYGSPSRHVLILRAGRVKIVVPTDHGWEALLAIRGPGDVLGELAALDAEPRSASVVALEAVATLEIPASQFVEFLGERPEAMLSLLRTLSHRLRESDRRSSELGGRSVESRLARRLLELAGAHGRGEDGGIALGVPLSQQDLADWIGSSREAVGHALGRLRRRGMVQTGRLRIVITDLEGLRDAAGL